MAGFWGAEIKPGQTVPFVPPPEGHRLHLSQATLASWSESANQRAAITCKTDDCNPLRICSLYERTHETINLDLVFDHYTEFEVVGATVHLSGYYMPTHSAEEDDEEDEEGWAALSPEEQQALRQQLALQHAFPGDYSSDDDDEEDDDFLPEGEDDDEDEDSDDEASRHGVIIEDVTENGLPQVPASHRKALPSPATPASAQNGSLKAGRRVRFDGAQVQGTAPEAPLSAAEAAVSSPAAESSPTPGSAPQPAQGAGKQGPEQPSSGKAGRKKRKAQDDAGSTPAAKRPAEAVRSPAGDAATTNAQLPSKAPVTTAAPADSHARPPKSATKPTKQAAALASPAEAQPAAAPAASAASSKKSRIRRYENGFQVQDVSMGNAEGRLAKPGLKVVVRYTGCLEKSGKVFDSSKPKGFNFRLGVGDVIKGWDLGISGMRVGDKRKLTIPPQLAYGTSGVKGAIPPNATLIFDVELLDVK